MWSLAQTTTTTGQGVLDAVPDWVLIASSVAVGLAATLNVLILLWKGSRKPFRWFGKVDTHVTTVGEHVAAVNEHMISVDTHIAAVDEHMTTTNRVIAAMRRDIKRLIVKVFGAGVGELAVEGASPLRLTDFGQRLAKEINADMWVKKLVPLLHERVKGKTPDAIEEECFAYFVYDEDDLPDDLKQQMSAVAYEHGIVRETVGAVLVVEFRDALIELEKA